MGVDGQFGSIQTGKVADLVVLDGNPLEDFHLIGKPVQALFIDGNLVINRCGLQTAQPADFSPIPGLPDWQVFFSSLRSLFRI